VSDADRLDAEMRGPGVREETLRARHRVKAAQEAHDKAREGARERLRTARAPREADLRRRQYACAVALAEATRELVEYLRDSVALGTAPSGDTAVFFGNLVSEAPYHEGLLDALRADLAARTITFG
jgi:hypothetical protein